MKNLLKLTLLLMLLVSCKDANQIKPLGTALDELTGNNEDVNEKYDLLLKELGTKTPLSDAQLQEAFPKKLKNLTLDGSEARVNRNKTAIGTFGEDTIAIEILDAAGENAVAAILPLKMLDLNKVTSENNNTIRYSKKERNGLLTFGTDRDRDTQSDYQSEIRFLYDKRFYVMVQGKGMNVDELWEAISLDDFSRFKAFNN